MRDSGVFYGKWRSGKEKRREKRRIMDKRTEAYLDNSATTRCSERAAELMKVLTEDYGNPSSLHQKGMEAETYVKEARKKIAKTLKCKEKEIIFTSGGTESNNLAIRGGAESKKRRGRHIITTSFEHPSAANPIKRLEEEGYEVTRLSVSSTGRIDLSEFAEAIREDTVLVSVMQVNNEIGAVVPVEEMAKIAKEKNPGLLFHVDAIQSYGKLPINLSRSNIDLMSVSGHKIHGPKGSGFLYIKEKTNLLPLILGGGQEWGLRSGTENVPAIAGLGVAAEEVAARPGENASRLYALRDRLIRGLLSIDGIRINGEHFTKEMWDNHGEEKEILQAPHIVSVSVKNVRAEVLLHALEERRVYVSAGSACSSNKPALSATLQAIGLSKELLDKTVRFSFSVHTTEEEIDYAIHEMEALVPMLSKFVRK